MHLAGILNETDLTEIEIEQDDLRIRVSRQGTPMMAAPQACMQLRPQRLSPL